MTCGTRRYRRRIRGYITWTFLFTAFAPPLCAQTGVSQQQKSAQAGNEKLLICFLFARRL
jgi:hypothetical protein